MKKFRKIKTTNTSSEENLPIVTEDVKTHRNIVTKKENYKKRYGTDSPVTPRMRKSR